MEFSSKSLILVEFEKTHKMDMYENEIPLYHFKKYTQSQPIETVYYA